jgi:hypothetical protein
MNDRELLELAAKAAGLEGDWSDGLNCIVIPLRGGQSRCWSPLEDDAQLFRLCVGLRIDIEHNNPLDNNLYVCASRCGIEMARDPVSIVVGIADEKDRLAATRRAGVRAAAEIGKTMKGASN